MNKPETKKEINRLVLLLSAVYMISYVTRINYGAIISEIEDATRMSKSLLSLALTGSFTAYGIGQIVSGICGDKISPKKLISCGFITTVLMNFLITLCTNHYQMLAVWSVNGFAQAFMWPPLVKIMTTLLPAEDYKEATVKVSWGSSVGTIAVYLISPLIISLMGWKAVFVFCCLCGIVILLLWNRYGYDVDINSCPVSISKSMRSNLFTPLMLSIMIVIILMGMLRDGITTWMPSYIAETYNMSNITAILSGVVLPVLSIVCYQATLKLHQKKFTNPLSCASAIFGAGALAALSLLIFSGKSLGYSVLFTAILTGCMHGVTLMLVCIIPSFFSKYGNVSTVSGILNSCAYAGSAISTYGTAVLTESFGWNYTLLIWLLTAAFGTAICVLCAGPWAKKFGQY